ncbi:hypothetical protein [Bacillus bingmayongensis]|uniref:hypothetical protein n=1 Tax=Bacillus bingmayongensis TaxID=1150157 RepID=UPI001C8CF519|nr:hypothetical protein [Bacillus bingmayongensis]MBY0594908.1 hypothetical protein [Bacillus bingmayongensis]
MVPRVPIRTVPTTVPATVPTTVPTTGPTTGPTTVPTMQGLSLSVIISMDLSAEAISVERITRTPYGTQVAIVSRTS